MIFNSLSNISKLLAKSPSGAKKRFFCNFHKLYTLIAYYYVSSLIFIALYTYPNAPRPNYYFIIY